MSISGLGSFCFTLALSCTSFHPKESCLAFPCKHLHMDMPKKFEHKILAEEQAKTCLLIQVQIFNLVNRLCIVWKSPISASKSLAISPRSKFCGFVQPHTYPSLFTALIMSSSLNLSLLPPKMGCLELQGQRLNRQNSQMK